MLARYTDEQTITAAADHADLLALIQRYDETVTDRPSKAGLGVAAFMRRRNHFSGGFTTAGFWLRRIDGTETDFSFVQAVKGQPREQDKEFTEACRVAVAADLKAAKERFFATYADIQGRVLCDVSGRLVTFDQAHIDHADPTFRQLVATFRAARGWRQSIPPGVLTAPADQQTQTSFVDPAVAGAFREFHKVALLRVVAADVNIALAAKTRRPHVNRPVVLP
jgi:hypothetical protein